jgi:hypothetical protein
VPAIRQQPNVASHFTKSAPAVKATYAALLKASRALGPVREDPKKTSIHLVHDAAFAGVSTRKDSLILTIKADHELVNPRVFRTQHTSARRWHVDIRLTRPADVDGELRGWLADSYRLAGK